MDFELDDEQAALRDVSRKLLAQHAGPAAARRLADTAAEDDPALWRAGTEIGWQALTVPEEYDGLGQGLVELALVAEELGRAVATGPFVISALVARLAAGGPAAAVATALAEGRESACWAIAEPGGSFDPDACTTTVRPDSGHDGAEAVLDGVKTAVEGAGTADWLLVTAAGPDGPESHVVHRDAPGLTVTRQRVLDETRPRYRVALDGVRAAHRVVGPVGSRALAGAATVLTAADALGAAEALLELTRDHVAVRRQFGREIGSFQAVKHAVADMLLVVRGARAAVYHAAMAIDAGAPEAELAVAVAGSFTSAGLSRVAGQALQLHGGIGFTWEHDLHLFLRRVKADETLHGDSTVHRERVLTLHGVR